MYETIIGGCLVLAGVLVTQLVHSVTVNRDRKERRDRLFREKYEELCDSILDTTQQVLDTLGLTGIDAISAGTPAGLQKTYYLAMIYFPEIRDAAMKYNNSVVALHQFCIGNCSLRAELSLSAQLCKHEGYQNYQDQMMVCRGELEKLIRNHADKYTRA